MILFDLNKQTLTGEGSDKVAEVMWADGQCLVNKVKSAPTKDITVTGSSAREVQEKISQIISGSKADLFAIMKQTVPFKIGGRCQAKFVYAEVTL